MPELAPEQHADFEKVEDDFNDALSISLEPRGPDFLYDVIATLDVPPGATVVDVGCGEGKHALELARRFAFIVHGVDPLPRHRHLTDPLAATEPDVHQRLSFRQGTAEAIPQPPATVDLVLCREMLYLVDDLTTAFTECRRVLKPGGRVVVYQLFNTDWLEPAEAVRFWRGVGDPRHADRSYFEGCVRQAGLAVDERIELGSETIEWAEEQSGKASREIRAAARLLRDPERYVGRFGQAAYDIKLNDALWHIYRMIGKLSQHIYVLRRPVA
jgi:ubiquinone/menaquinone biosynthesis C-methylase UbiE